MKSFFSDPPQNFVFYLSSSPILKKYLELQLFVCEFVIDQTRFVLNHLCFHHSTILSSKKKGKRKEDQERGKEEGREEKKEMTKGKEIRKS